MPGRRHLAVLIALLTACALLLPAAAPAQTTSDGSSSGETASGTSGEASSTDGTTQAPPPTPSRRARLAGGKAIPPEGAPLAVRRAIRAANRIAEKPYRYGGGHARWNDTGYDCSGAVSYVLHGARLLDRALNSRGFMRWGRRGRGRWMTVYARSSHSYIVIAGLRFDTGWRDDYGRRHGAKPGSGPRWGARRSTRGFRARHPRGL